MSLYLRRTKGQKSKKAKRQNYTFFHINFQSSISFSIFAIILVVEHRKVRLITALGNKMIIDGLQNGTSRFMGMGAVRKTALLGIFEYLTEIAGQFLAFHIEGTEALDAWGVDEVGITPPRPSRGSGKGNHL
jgi:hypothetical protein